MAKAGKDGLRSPNCSAYLSCWYQNSFSKTSQISFLHTTHKGKPTLAFDLIEEFRPSIVDCAVLALLNRREHASVGEDGNLTQETRRNLIANIQTRLSTILNFRRKELKIDEIIFHQTQSLVCHLQGQSKYKPFIEKW